MSDQNQNDVQKWMEEVATQGATKNKLIFDKKTKRLISVPATDPRADDCLEFTAQEATRFA
ncbi:MAG: hypothetical protein BGO01_00965 [Armatimonadetes bacterium 55-13]|nr:hypothetical protein [Armatimonadota bacterium]OJU62375.1 MAG: hypothetical protein BGO01_00965 [Armatimonadetes bacterium 55-13]